MISQLFAEMDIDGSNKVPKHRYLEFLREHKPKHGPWKSVAKLQRRLGLDKRHHIDLATFKAAVEKIGIDVAEFDFNFSEVTFFDIDTSRHSAESSELLLSVYDKWDTDSDGKLTQEELARGMASAIATTGTVPVPGQYPLQHYLPTGLSLADVPNADADGDGVVSKQEWLDFFEPIPADKISGVREWFWGSQHSVELIRLLLDVYNKWDTNGDGELSLEELAVGFKSTGKMSAHGQDSLDQFLRPGLSLADLLKADTDGDGFVSKKEWLDFFNPILKAELEGIKEWFGVA